MPQLHRDWSKHAALQQYRKIRKLGEGSYGEVRVFREYAASVTMPSLSYLLYGRWPVTEAVT
jgi:hypothetical protein